MVIVVVFSVVVPGRQTDRQTKKARKCARLQRETIRQARTRELARHAGGAMRGSLARIAHCKKERETF